MENDDVESSSRKQESNPFRGSSIFQTGTFDSEIIASFFYHGFTFRRNMESSIGKTDTGFLSTLRLGA